MTKLKVTPFSPPGRVSAKVLVNHPGWKKPFGKTAYSRDFRNRWSLCDLKMDTESPLAIVWSPPGACDSALLCNRLSLPFLLCHARLIWILSTAIRWVLGTYGSPEWGLRLHGDTVLMKQRAAGVVRVYSVGSSQFKSLHGSMMFCCPMALQLCWLLVARSGPYVILSASVGTFCFGTVFGNILVMS